MYNAGYKSLLFDYYDIAAQQSLNHAVLASLDRA